MDKTNVIWRSWHDDVLARGYWDDGLLEDVFKRGDFNHIELVTEPMPDIEGGAVYVINGRTHVDDVEKINLDLAKLEWCVFIITGDEEALFPWQEIKHPMIRIWVMLPRMNIHNDVAFKIPNGYRTDTHKILQEIGPQERKLDWSFVGQVNHERRQQCFDVLNQFKPLYPSSVVVGTDGFGKEALQFREYLQVMAESKIVLCPSGIETPDSFRLYEALEAGCIPVVDAFSTNFKTPGFWKYLFDEDPPFPIVAYWDELPQLLPTLLKEYPANANKIFSWWIQYKSKIRNKLMDDIKVLHG